MPGIIPLDASFGGILNGWLNEVEVGTHEILHCGEVLAFRTIGVRRMIRYPLKIIYCYRLRALQFVEIVVVQTILFTRSPMRHLYEVP
jgi:hypothetical protein